MADEIVAVEIREVEGFPGYGVSADGRVWTRWRRGPGSMPCLDWKERKQSTHEYGYKTVKMRCKRTVVLVHRLVLAAFEGQQPEGMECCHNDGNPANNHIDNLRWDTKSANSLDRHQHGTGNRGERHNMVKLTESQVSEIRKLASTGVYQDVIAQKFGIIQQTVSDIVRRKRWKHVA